VETIGVIMRRMKNDVNYTEVEALMRREETNQEMRRGPEMKKPLTSREQGNDSCRVLL